MGIDLPVAPKPVGSYVASARAGKLVFTAGQLPMKDGKLLAEGKVPAEVDLATAQAAARRAVLNALAAVKAELGSLDSVTGIVRLNCFVNSSPGFTDQAQVANGASDALTEIFAEAGLHTRCAIGAAELPLNAAVELDLIVQVA